MGEISATFQRLGTAIIVAVGGAFAKWFTATKLTKEDEIIRKEIAELRIKNIELMTEIEVLRKTLGLKNDS